MFFKVDQQNLHLHITAAIFWVIYQTKTIKLNDIFESQATSGPKEPHSCPEFDCYALVVVHMSKQLKMIPLRHAELFCTKIEIQTGASNRFCRI